MKRAVMGLVVVACGMAGPVLAEDAAACAASFPERLADAKHAITEHDKLAAEYGKSGADKKMAWFDAHCRFLSEFEIAVRKLDDPNSFVCDPKATGRPKGLTTEFVTKALASVPMASELQKFHGENGFCAESDEKERISLYVNDLPLGKKLELLCYADERESCQKAREAIAKARAKGKL